MPDLVGFVSIALVCLFTSFLASKSKDISNIILIALIIRIIIILIGHYIVPLPDTTADAESYEEDAWFKIAENGFVNLLNYYPGIDNHFYTWLLAIPYSLFGRSILMLQSISLLFGICCIFYGWKIGTILWDKHVAKKIAFTIAFFPSLILYSVITMKEVFVCFFLLLAIHSAIIWARTNSSKHIIITLIGFLGATFFHGAMVAGAVIFLMIVFFYNFKILIKSLKNFSLSKKILFPISFIIFSFLYIVINEVNIPKLGELNRLLDPNFFRVKTIVSTKGDSAFPQWTVAQSFGELIYKTPLRAIYFMFSPFPWDIGKKVHLIGFLDSLLYYYLVFLIYRNRKVIWKDPALRVILIILLFYIIIFGIGVGNFGTSIRHRSKFVIMLILLAGPFLKKIVLGKKNETTNKFV